MLSKERHQTATGPKGLGLAKPSEEEEQIECSVNWVFEIIDLRSPISQIFNDGIVDFFCMPFDGDGRRLG